MTSGSVSLLAVSAAVLLSLDGRSVPGQDEGREAERTPLEDVRSFDVLEALPLEPERVQEQAAWIAAATGHPLELVRRTEGYRATVRDPRTQREVETLLFLVPLAPPLAGGRVAAAANAEGDLFALDCLGPVDFSSDSWGTFLNQFFASSQLGTSEFRQAPRGASGAGALDERLEALAPEDAAAARTLVRQRQLMKKNRLFLGHLQQTILRRRPLEAGWFRDQAADFRGLEQDASRLAPFLGRDELSGYRGRLVDLAAVMERLGALVDEDALDAASFRSEVGPLSRGCQACHESPAPDGEGGLKEYLARLRADLDLPRGLFRVGYDVAPPPGLGVEEVQPLATALRVSLLLDRALRD